MHVVSDAQEVASEGSEEEAPPLASFVVRAVIFDTGTEESSKVEGESANGVDVSHVHEGDCEHVGKSDADVSGEVIRRGLHLIEDVELKHVPDRESHENLSLFGLSRSDEHRVHRRGMEHSPRADSAAAKLSR